MAVDFYGPRLKVQRADQHIGELEGIFRQHIDTHKKLVAGEPDSDAGRERIFGFAFPEITPAVIGDAVHNLRAALDHAYCLLVETNKQVVNSTTMFPFVGKASELKGRIAGAEKKPNPVPSAAVIAAITDEIQPYEGGRMSLYGLHRLDRTDKHTMLIPATSEIRLPGSALSVAMPDGGEFKIVGLSFQSKLNPAGGLIAIPPGGAVKFEGDLDSAFEIRFGKGQPFENEAIVGKLRELQGLTLEALKILERAASK